MDKRDLSLSNRIEEVRERKICVVHFELFEIKGHFDESLSSIKNQFQVAEDLAAVGKTEECKAIWRSQIVFLEGILDFYIHELSKYALYKMFTGDWQKSQKYSSLLVPMREIENSLLKVDSKEWFFDYLNERFSRDVFLSSENMKEQLNLIGVSFGKVMENAFPMKTINESHKYGSKVIQNLFNRRNAIAHQLDRNHASAEQNDIDRAFVEECIGNVEKIIAAIQQIAESNE